MSAIKAFKDQDYQYLKRQHSVHHLFEDQHFPPTSTTLSHTGRKFHHLQWRRAAEMVSNPQFVIKSFHRGDLDQGELGNCWFLAAVGGVTLHPDLLEQVVPPDQSFNEHQYRGIFHFRFWINGQWYDVVIDDFLPCNSNGELVFCRNKVEGNELWGPLLEKAYAKVCGSYEAMESGSPIDALIDMTGGIDEAFDLGDSCHKSFDGKENLKNKIIQAKHNQAMFGCAIYAERGGTRDSHRGSEGHLSNGLLAGHAYSITAVDEVQVGSQNVTIIRCLNPWGDETEWNGDFSDGSSIWDYVSDTERQRLKFKERRDGEFWISFDDFLETFDNLCICHRPPKSIQTNDMTKWSEAIFHGKWKRGVTAGGCGNGDNRKHFKNPQYLLEINFADNDSDECTVMVGLMQKTPTQYRTNSSSLLQIGFSLHKVNDNVDIPRNVQQGNYQFNINEVDRIGDSGSYINKRQLVHRFTVSPGNYVLIPSTFRPDEEGQFLLRVFTEQKINGQATTEYQEDSYGFETDEDESARNPFESSYDEPPIERLRIGDDFRDDEFVHRHECVYTGPDSTGSENEPCSIM